MDPGYALEILLVFVGLASMVIQDRKKKEREAEQAKRTEERLLAEEAAKAEAEAESEEANGESAH